MIEVRLPMLEYDFSTQPDQGFDEVTGEHGGYEMGVRGSSNPDRRRRRVIEPVFSSASLRTYVSSR